MEEDILIKMFPLTKALLCIDCDMVFERPQKTTDIFCPGCSGRSFVYVSKFLNRKEKTNLDVKKKK
jgi:DNA-directed RNA polymerase subunit RPC12/RpoP